MTGRIISHYNITEKLGEGGMGVVYKAEDTKLNRPVAIKFLSSGDAPDKISHQRFEQEAQSAAALSHSNICHIYDYDEHEGRPFLVMEYLEGETLRAKMDKGNLTIQEALDYGAKIADALAEAHEQDIIHRDIKPENIMIDEDGRLKVMDFGLAKLKHTQDITKTGDTVGTLAYMSPEQIQGKDVDHRADLFSLGIVLYEMLTGSKPFRGEHEAAMTYAIVNEDPAPIQQYLTEAPDELIRFLDAVLAKDPEDRLGSAAEVAELLEELKESANIIPQQSSPAEAEYEANEQDSDSISTTFSIFGFGNNSFGKVGILAISTGILALVLFVGWWVIGGDWIKNNTAAPPNGEQSEITDRSIAVLPFTNQGGGEEVASITRGLHDDLLTRLSNIGDLQVTSGTSVEQFRDTDLSLPIIADSLGVQWIVEGGVQEAGDQIRVNAQLIEPQDDVHAWADSYRRKLTAENLFAIQEEVAGEIAGALQTQLSPSEQERIAGAPTQNLGAYRLYVQGRSALNTRTEQGMVKAMDYFRRAIRQDSSYALAWSGLADAMGLSSSYGPDSLEISDSEYESAARRALELDPQLAEAQASMGHFYMDQQRNAPAALHHLSRAVELKPSYGQAHHWLGYIYLVIGQSSKASDHLSLAVKLNPQHNAIRPIFVWALVAQDNIKKAREQVNWTRGTEQVIYFPYLESIVLYHEKNWDKLEQLSKNQLSQASENNQGLWRFNLGRVAAIKGDTSAVREQLTKLRQEQERFKFIHQALLHAVLEERDAVFEALSKTEIEQLITGAFVSIRYFYSDILDPLRQDPRYEKLIRRFNESWGLKPDGSIPEEKKLCKKRYL